MRAPVTYAVARHLVAHPDDGPSAIAKHCSLHVPSVSIALKRFRDQDIWGEEQLLEAMRKVSETPAVRTYHFLAPNPEIWLKQFPAKAWLSGEYAATMDGMDLVPERMLVYVRKQDIALALQAAKEVFAKVAPSSKANLSIREADPWLHLDPKSDVVERGQRLVDYQESKHIQILREMGRA